jgi:hypothetical protein
MQRAARWILASVFAAGVTFVSAPSQARVYVDVDVAPPPPRVEVVPAPRAGYVWVPGYYAYNGHRHVWNHGHWVRERHGYHWSADRWVERNGRWHHDRGRWDRD